jgi:hypothetical protein
MKKEFIVDCSDCNHPNIVISVDDDIVEDDIAILTSHLRLSVATGTTYNDGETLQFGSMLCRFRKVDGSLVMQEPDLKAVPIFWVDDMSSSLRLIRLQKDICESVGLVDGLDFPSVRASLLRGTDVTGYSKNLLLERTPGEDLDTGWFIGLADSEIDYNDHLNLERISVYQAILDLPQIAGFLAFPQGYRIETSKTRSRLWYNGNELSIQKGSLLHHAMVN